MRLPVPAPSIEVKVLATRFVGPLLLCLCSLSWPSPRSIAQDERSPMSARERIHQSDQWAEIKRHLPDPATATPQALEQQADILRARRFPEDAMDYYRFALDRGGQPESLLNKLGLSELEMRHIQLARVYFQRVVKMNRKDSEAWNNLGAVEFVDGLTSNAISDYKKAIKLNKHSAVYHSNLASAYFQTKDYGAARREIATALKLDPQIFDRKEGFGGIEAHVLTSQDRARLAFEMAKLFAQNGMEEQMLHSLAMASEAGMDVQREMAHDASLAKYQMDPRVIVIVRNAREMQQGHKATVNAAALAGAAESNPL
jgi:tetratricopeptide (TPR) repeat protein